MRLASFVLMGIIKHILLVAMNQRCFLINCEKNLVQIRLVVFEKNKNTAQLQRTPIPKKWRHWAEG